MTTATLPTQHPDPAVQALAVLACRDLDAALAQVRATITKEHTR
jgi:hypothetical protein